MKTDRDGFFSKRRRRQHNPESNSRSGSSTRGVGGFAVGDDAMAAMALAAMTQELSVMKQSLQAEVGRPRMYGGRDSHDD